MCNGGSLGWTIPEGELRIMAKVQKTYTQEFNSGFHF